MLVIYVYYGLVDWNFISLEKLLSLHVNITKVQQSLFDATESRIAESLAVMQDTREWGQEIKQLHEEVLKLVHNIKDFAVDALMDNNARVSGVLSELTEQFKSSQEISNTLSSELGKVINFWVLIMGLPWHLLQSRSTLTQVISGVILRLTDGLSQLEESSREITDEQGKLLRENTALAQQLQSSLTFTKDFTVDPLARSIEHLSSTLVWNLQHFSQQRLNWTDIVAGDSERLKKRTNIFNIFIWGKCH